MAAMSEALEWAEAGDDAVIAAIDLAPAPQESVHRVHATASVEISQISKGADQLSARATHYVAGTLAI